MAQGFAKALIEHSREVAELEGDQAAEFLRLLKDMRERLTGRLVALGGQEQTFDAYKIRSVLAETEAGISTLEKKAAGQYRRGASDAVDLSVDHLTSDIDRLSKAFDASPIQVSLDAVKVLADPMQGLLANHFETSVKRYGLEALNGVRRELFLGLRAGDSYGDIIKAVSSNTGPLGQVSRSSGERIVRTEISQAYGAASHQAQLHAAKQIPGLKKIWMHVGSWLCPICGPLHGTERPLDGTWTIRLGKKTKQVAHPPGHPNCTCRTTSMKKSWRTGLEKLGYLEQQPDTGEEGHAQL